MKKLDLNSLISLITEQEKSKFTPNEPKIGDSGFDQEAYSIFSGENLNTAFKLSRLSSLCVL